MGLDNIPHKYPCKTQGTAVFTVRRDKDGNPLIDDDGSEMTVIDCQTTQKQGGCPYENSYATAGLATNGVIGMFGTDCWYRGKYGNFLLEEMGLYDETEGLSFYGALGDNSYKSPHECDILANAMEKWLSDNKVLKVDYNAENVTEEVRYAIWYLRWASVNCGGLDCWY